MAKIIKIVDENDIEELYQLFCKKLVKDFKSGKKPEGRLDPLMKWMRKHSDLTDEMAVHTIKEFLEVMSQDTRFEDLSRVENGD